MCAVNIMERSLKQKVIQTSGLGFCVIVFFLNKKSQHTSREMTGQKQQRHVSQGAEVWKVTT